MNVQTIEMDPAEAREALREYRTALHRSADEEYQAAAAGYEALAEGTPVLNYGPAIASAPRDEKSRPMLAIARADRKQVKFRWDGRTRTASFDVSAGFRQSLFESSLLRLWVDMGAPHGQERRSRAYSWPTTINGYALVPMVPPKALRACGGRSKLRDHLILWEVEQWSDAVIGAVPDRDPYLLRPIHGDLCAVVASWDLTELERSVMAGRAVG